MVMHRVLLSLFVTLGSGCALIAGLTDHEPLPQASGGAGGVGGAGGSGGTLVNVTSAGPSSGSGGSAGGCSGEACIGCPGEVVYVSTTGSDANDGCTQEAPKKTIHAAIAFVKAEGAQGHEVHVCAGKYPEANLVLDYPVTLLGGHACGSWARTATYGYPMFDGENETIVTNANYPSSTETLVISGADVSPSVRVDGFTIQAPAAGVGASVAVRVTTGAAAVLSNNLLEGGSTSVGSVGLYIEGASPDISRNRVHGGESAGAQGAVAIRAIDGTPKIHLNQVTGGKSVVGNTGLYLSSSSPVAYTGEAAITENSFRGGTGALCSAVSIVGQVSADIERNFLDGGEGKTLFGLFSAGAGKLRLEGNRIYGGKVVTAEAGEASGLYILAPTGLRVVNNLIHGGHAGLATGTGATFALDLDGSALPPQDSALIAHNTLFPGVPKGASAFGVRLSAGVKHVRVENNIFAGSRSSDTGLLIAECGEMLTALNNNLFFNQSGPIFQVGTMKAGCIASTYNMILPAENALKISSPAPAVGGNVTLETDCALAGENSNRCFSLPACGGSSNACLTALFSTWDLNSAGYKELMAVGGWPLRQGAPCLVTKGGLDLTNVVAADVLQSPRTPPVSIGAHEADGACAQ